VSACLLGIRCRYDGSSKTRRSLLNIQNIIIIPVCPEQLGGLSTPRPNAYFVGGDGEALVKGRAFLRDIHDQDVTHAFLFGAGQVCKVARILGARYAILKEESPSCGTHTVWIEGNLQRGYGVTSAMLKDLGLSLMNEDGLML
jgi:uncharacterized protein YbbK (DUF523 family)